MVVAAAMDIWWWVVPTTLAAFVVTLLVIAVVTAAVSDPAGARCICTDLTTAVSNWLRRRAMLIHVVDGNTFSCFAIIAAVMFIGYQSMMQSQQPETESVETPSRPPDDEQAALLSVQRFFKFAGVVCTILLLMLVGLILNGQWVRHLDYLRDQELTPLEKLEGFLINKDDWKPMKECGSIEWQLQHASKILEELLRESRPTRPDSAAFLLRTEAKGLLHGWKAQIAQEQGAMDLKMAHLEMQAVLKQMERKERKRCLRLELARVMHKFQVPEDIGRRVADIVWALPISQITGRPMPEMLVRIESGEDVTSLLCERYGVEELQAEELLSLAALNGDGY